MKHRDKDQIRDKLLRFATWRSDDGDGEADRIRTVFCSLCLGVSWMSNGLFMLQRVLIVSCKAVNICSLLNR